MAALGLTYGAEYFTDGVAEYAGTNCTFTITYILKGIWINRMKILKVMNWFGYESCR